MASGVWWIVAGVTIWRLIESGCEDAYTNMAVDQAIMEAVGQGLAPPTLRLYGWDPPGVSLGNFQELNQQVDIAAIARRGWDLVRRPTGGRAILHDDEVTYSVCIRQEALQHGDSVLRSYKELSRGIQCGLELLGVSVALGSGPKHKKTESDGRKLPTVCFTQSTQADMVAAGRKIAGSAQVRRDGTILQHGSVPLTLNIEDHLAVMPTGNDEEAAQALRRGAVSVSETLGQPVSFAQLSEALVAGFAQAFEVEMKPAELSDKEATRAQELCTNKYATEQWNYHWPTGR